MKISTPFKVLILSLFVISCRKEDRLPSDKFAVSGVINVDLTSVNSFNMPLNITAINGGDNKIVNLSISGLPNGIILKSDSLGGIPNFTTNLQFQNKSLFKSKTYPIKLIATSDERIIPYNFNLNVPTINGYIIDGKMIQKLSTQKSMFGDRTYIVFSHLEDGETRFLSITFFKQFYPTVSREFNIGDLDPKDSNEVVLHHYNENVTRYGTPTFFQNKKLKINITEGKLNVQFMDVEFTIQPQTEFKRYRISADVSE